MPGIEFQHPIVSRHCLLRPVEVLEVDAPVVTTSDMPGTAREHPVGDRQSALQLAAAGQNIGVVEVRFDVVGPLLDRRGVAADCLVEIPLLAKQYPQGVPGLRMVRGARNDAAEQRDRAVILG